MPLFDFKCRDCGKDVEKITTSSVREVECPACGGRAEKQISAPADFQDKGTIGFHKAGANFKTFN